MFIGNLAWGVTEEDVASFFKEAGEVSSVRLAKDKHTGEFRGFGHVDFKEQARGTVRVSHVGYKDQVGAGPLQLSPCTPVSAT